MGIVGNLTEGAALLMEGLAKSLLERASDGSRDGLKSRAGLPAIDETRPHGDPVLPGVQGRPRPRRRCREGRDPRRLAVLQEVQSPIRDQGRDSGPASYRLQMNSDCAATTPAPSFATAYAARGYRLRLKKC